MESVYYRIKDYSYEGREDLSLVKRASFVHIPWLLGIPWTATVTAPITVDLSKDMGGDIIPDLFLTGLPLLSPKVLAILESLGIDNFDLYDADITTRTGEHITDYKAFYLIGALACMDEGNSNFRKLHPGRISVWDLVIDESRTMGMPMFRLAEDPLWLLISEEVKEAFEAADVLGAYYTPVPCT
ncbi:hypothetical protein G6O69_33810 [Pseudenhygromyxa sp. WMMC2535]|uniref:imm11 family protein n=1 Tax=Pseudenhygromyxa sp. WMMC2535 TaxID=2712867 RepID=UPI0015545994|nr:hypothetical protein [Pseudenhygromyxa sp. WMMC2535]NVB42846.1 hypothetical protein [Pseudenhygromyxa sp. WMMC2535]